VTPSRPFDVPSFARALPPAVGVGRTLAGDWRIQDIGWGPDEAIELQVVKGSADADLVRVLVRARAESGPVFRRTAHFDIVYVLPEGGARSLPSDAQLDLALRRLVGAIRWMDRPDLEWAWPSKRSASNAPSMASFERSDVIQVAIDSPCGSRCQFCTFATLDRVAPTFDDGYHDALVARMERGRLEGARILGVAGFDPLTYPSIVPLVQRARELGFDLVEIQTTGLPLADAGLLDALLGALSPCPMRLLVPLYGATPAVHDAVTGRPGAHALLMTALGHIARRAWPGVLEVAVTSVILPGNVRELGEARSISERFGFSFFAHLAYPSAGGRLTLYRRSAMRISEAVRILHGLERPMLVAESPPCVLLRHERETGVPSLTKLYPGPAPLSGSHAHPRMPLVTVRGGEQEESVTMACPQAPRCALAPHCMQRIYRAYAEEFGLDEFVAVRPEEIPDAVRDGF
jgi:hypothetical protein